MVENSYNDETFQRRVAFNFENEEEKKEELDSAENGSTTVDKYAIPDDACLLLSREETFFLTFALDCLQVKQQRQQYQVLLSTRQLWKIFSEASSDFVERYVVYHHFRSKGLVPRSGAKFAAPYVIYHRGPAYHHSSYVVHIETHKHAEGKKKKRSGKLKWNDLNALMRVTASVSKQLILVYLKFPPPHKLSNVECLSEFSIKELLVSRWVSNKEIERELLDADCDF